MLVLCIMPDVGTLFSSWILSDFSQIKFSPSERDCYMPRASTTYVMLQQTGQTLLGHQHDLSQFLGKLPRSTVIRRMGLLATWRRLLMYKGRHDTVVCGQRRKQILRSKIFGTSFFCEV